MTNIKEKLIELLWEYDQMRMMRMSIEECVDRLIPKGVTVQEWISVKDKLPEDVYGKDREKIVVLVCTKSGKVSQCARCADYNCKTDATLSKVEWIKNGQFYWSKGKRVTHWMSLPRPPKEV